MTMGKILLIVFFIGISVWGISAMGGDPVSPPVVTQPVSTQDIVVTSQIVKAVDGKYRYFFDIRNQDDEAFSGDVKIELDKPSGERVFNTSFSTTQPIQPGVGTSQFVEAHTGPVSVHGANGVQTFKYMVSSGGSVIKTGQGVISTKLETL